MDRVSNNLLTNNFLHDVNRQQEGISRIQKQLSSQSKILSPSDDPVGTAEFMHQRSRLNDIDRFTRNITFSKSRLDATEGAVKGVTEILQRGHELAIQGANGTYTKDDRAAIALEVDELLNQTIELANTQHKGAALFGGTTSEAQAFMVETAQVVNPVTGDVEQGRATISKVKYQGDNNAHFAEVGRGEYIKTNINGNEAFFSSNQMIVSGTPGSTYVANRDQVMRVDGVEIDVKVGDNLQAVADKINNSKLSVHASIDNSGGQNLLSLKSTTPHQIYLEDLGGGSVLQDLGMIDSAVSAPPENYSPSAVVYQNSIFDRLIELRNSLYFNDGEALNRSIGGMAESLQNNTAQLAQIGATQNRVENTEGRLSQQKLYTQETISKIKDLDPTEAITELQKWQTELQASLKIGSQVLPRTLLDFL